jgi:hypothetical protein
MIEGKIGFACVSYLTQVTGSPWFSRTSGYYPLYPTIPLFPFPRASIPGLFHRHTSLLNMLIAQSYFAMPLNYIIVLHINLFLSLPLSLASFPPSFHPPILQTRFPHHAPIAHSARIRSRPNDFLRFLRFRVSHFHRPR